MRDLGFGTVAIDHNKRKVIIDINHTKPYAYFSNKIYSKIIVKNSHDKVIFSKTVRGTNVKISYDEIPFALGDIIVC